MGNRKIIVILLGLLFLVNVAITCHAQAEKKFSYYININTVDQNIPFSIMDGTLNFTYTDRFGIDKESLLKIFDWKHEQVASLRIDKTQGLNSYQINLDDIYSAWKFEHLYNAELVDEEGRTYTLPFKLVAPPDDIGPNIDIFVNPMQISCNGLGANMVEFYGNISGGRAPFFTQWFVLNETKTDFLYQPREEIIESVGKTPQIKVDKSPEYFVVFYVKDACGKEQKKMVKLVCDKGQKKINTIFIEQLPETLFNPGNKGQ